MERKYFVYQGPNFGLKFTNLIILKTRRHSLLPYYIRILSLNKITIYSKSFL